MKDEILLSRIIEYCTETESDRIRFGDSLDDFLDDSGYQRACSMNLIQIGETINKLSAEFKEQHDGYDWKAVIGFRNIAVHKYEHIDRTRVWEIISVDVPILKSVCENILSKMK
jgi:uncharacterized protein with HEPN domain